MKKNYLLLIAYTISLAVCFVNTFQGELFSFYLKYIITVFWIVLFVLDSWKKNLRFRPNSIWFKSMVPYVFVAVWSIVCMCLRGYFELSYFTRCIGSVSYILLTFINVFVGLHFFGKNSLTSCFVAMVFSFSANLFVTIGTYGMGSFLKYMWMILTWQKIAMNSIEGAISGCLEIQDITIASGLFIIYGLFFSKHKLRLIVVALSIIMFIIGIKRTAIVSLGVCFVFMLLAGLRWRRRCASPWLFPVFFVATVAYLLIIKFNLLEWISAAFSINTMGRISIYHKLNSYLDLPSFLFGHGFGIVDKVMYEGIGFVSHTVIGKMAAEIGFIPFFFWLWFYLMRLPNYLSHEFSTSVANKYLCIAIYVFVTFFFENTLSLYCVQFCFLMIPFAGLTGHKMNDEVLPQRENVYERNFNTYTM